MKIQPNFYGTELVLLLRQHPHELFHLEATVPVSISVEWDLALSSSKIRPDIFFGI